MGLGDAETAPAQPLGFKPCTAPRPVVLGLGSASVDRDTHQGGRRRRGARRRGDARGCVRGARRLMFQVCSRTRRSAVVAQSSRSRRSIVVVVVDETWMVGDVHAIEHGTGDVDVERGRVPRRGRMARVVVGDVGGDGEGVVKHPSFKVCGV